MYQAPAPAIAPVVADLAKLRMSCPVVGCSILANCIPNRAAAAPSAFVLLGTLANKSTDKASLPRMFSELSFWRQSYVLPSHYHHRTSLPAITSVSDRFNLVRPLHSYSEWNSFLFEISPWSGLGPIDLHTYDQCLSLLLDSNLSTQTDCHLLVFWSNTKSEQKS